MSRFERDAQVGQLLKKLDDLGIAHNTIVIYTTDNGAESCTEAARDQFRKSMTLITATAHHVDCDCAQINAEFR